MMNKALLLRIFLAFFQSTTLFAETSAAKAVLSSSLVLAPLSAKDLETQLKQAGAKATIINLWATWCAPCKEEMPELLALRARFAPRGVRLVLVSADSPADQSAAASFIGRLGADFPVYRIGEAPDKFMKVFEPHWPMTLPTTMLFDGEGRRIGYWIGRVSIKEVEKRLAKALAPLAPPEKMGSDQKSPWRDRATKTGKTK